MILMIILIIIIALLLALTGALLTLSFWPYIVNSISLGLTGAMIATIEIEGIGKSTIAIATIIGIVALWGIMGLSKKSRISMIPFFIAPQIGIGFIALLIAREKDINPAPLLAALLGITSLITILKVIRGMRDVRIYTVDEFSIECKVLSSIGWFYCGWSATFWWLSYYCEYSAMHGGSLGMLYINDPPGYLRYMFIMSTIIGAILIVVGLFVSYLVQKSYEKKLITASHDRYNTAPVAQNYNYSQPEYHDQELEWKTKFIKNGKRLSEEYLSISKKQNNYLETYFFNAHNIWHSDKTRKWLDTYLTQSSTTADYYNGVFVGTYNTFLDTNGAYSDRETLGNIFKNMSLHKKKLKETFDGLRTSVIEDHDEQIRREAYYQGKMDGSQAREQENREDENQTNFFSGCNNDPESIKKRYHQLLKIYHPDNGNGDEETTKQIQAEYDELMKQFD